MLLHPIDEFPPELTSVKHVAVRAIMFKHR